MSMFTEPLDPQISPAIALMSEKTSSKVPDDWFTEFGLGPVIAPRFSTILAGFEHFASVNPHEIAVVFGDLNMTYQDLNESAERLAFVLREQGIGHGDAVGLYLKRSIEMVVGIVAIMKLGAKYIPQHVGVATDETLRHISTVTRAKCVLTIAECAAQVPLVDGQKLLVIEDILADATIDRVSGESPLLPSDTCMILFTSGTTGVPNGVQVTHKNLCNILQTAPGDLGMCPGRKIGQILSIAFDMAAWEILGCISNGATLVIRGRDIQETANQVDILIATPSILGTLDATACQQVKVAAVAGEPCPRPLADKWASFCNFYNSCGPTETTIINTAMMHSPIKPDLTIGKPTPNNTVYILDDDLKPLPFGKTGEMWAGGDCVTAGYLANDNLNAERYRPDPFRPGHLMFRTRDLGAWTENGELLHFGRVDDLVKIRGFRVELDGVSRALEHAEGCEQAVTLKFDDRTLVSFVSPACANVEKAQLNVETRLPYYCVPKTIIAMDDLPKTPRGKLDKRLLLKLAAKQLAQSALEAAE